MHNFKIIIIFKSIKLGKKEEVEDKTEWEAGIQRTEASFALKTNGSQ